MSTRALLRTIASGTLLLFTALTAAQAAAPAASPLPAGEYLLDGGWGSMVITNRAGVTRFDIRAIGANGHSCSADGVVKGREARLNEDMPEQLCLVKFAETAQGIEVIDATKGGCRGVCGARATFEGKFNRPPAGCTRAQQQSSRKNFSTLYRAKSYEAALAALSPVLSQCGRTLHWVTEAAIRNDIAITQHHLGQRSECLATLQPLAQRAAKSDAQLKEEMEPIEYLDFLPYAKATRHNLALCSRAP